VLSQIISSENDGEIDNSEYGGTPDQKEYAKTSDDGANEKQTAGVQSVSNLSTSLMGEIV